MKPFTIRPIAPRKRAFTIMELMVAITILTLILASMSVIWSAQRTVVQSAAAQTEVAPYARALESNLRRDLNGLSHDGFMVIRSGTKPNVSVNGDPAHTYYYDQLMFFANGLKNSVKTPTNSSMTSRVWYGHLITSDWSGPGGGGTVDFPNSSVLPWKMSLGRQDLLLMPGLNAAGLPTTLNDPTILAGTNDFVVSDMMTIKQAMLSGINTANIAKMSSACFRINGERFMDWTTGPSNMMQIHALLAPYCSSFRVQFAGRYLPATLAGQVDVYPTGHMNAQGVSDAQQPIWYGTDESGNMNPPPSFGTSINSGTVTNGGAQSFVFSPDNTTLWPSMIAITVDLHDSNGRFHDRFKRQVKTPGGAQAVDGYQYRFIIKL